MIGAANRRVPAACTFPHSPGYRLDKNTFIDRSLKDSLERETVTLKD